MRFQGASDLSRCTPHERHDRTSVARRTHRNRKPPFGTHEHNAKITAQKISQDMETLSHKLEDMEKNICRAI